MLRTEAGTEPFSMTAALPGITVESCPLRTSVSFRRRSVVRKNAELAWKFANGWDNPLCVQLCIQVPQRCRFIPTRFLTGNTTRRRSCGRRSIGVTDNNSPPRPDCKDRRPDRDPSENITDLREKLLVAWEPLQHSDQLFHGFNRLKRNETPPEQSRSFENFGGEN